MANFFDDDRWQNHADPFRVAPYKARTLFYRALGALGKYNNPLGLPAWPNPVNYIVDYQELACGDTWQAYVKFAFAEAAYFAWATFVPNPSEILRKFLLGSYKCGFYFGGGFKSPMTLFVDEDAFEVLVEFQRPAQALTFYWWMAASAYTAFQTWQTVMHKSDRCFPENANVILGPGEGEFNIATGLATPAFYNVIKNDDGLYPGAGADVFVPAGTWHVAYSYSFDARLHTATSLDVSLYVDGTPTNTKSFNPQNTPTKQGVAYHKFTTANPVSLRVVAHATGLPPLGFLTFDVLRWTVSAQAEGPG